MEQIYQAETIAKQLEELEMLQSIYPEPGELIVHDCSVISDARHFVAEAGHTGIVLQKLSYVIHISCLTMKFIATCELPLNYPDESPDISIRADDLHRINQRQLNEDLEEFILETESGEVCVWNALQWVQEKIATYKDIEEKPAPAKQMVGTRKGAKNETFSRLWILSHHIYSKYKRRDILEWSAELKLSGFSLPGKPGIVCVEGPTSDTEEFWYCLRRLNWKKISCKHREDFPFQRKENRCFDKFEELNFKAKGFGTGRHYHMDLGMLQKYLEEKGFKDIFKILLGVEGKAAAKQ